MKRQVRTIISPAQLAKAFAAAKKIQSLIEEMNEIFPGRENLLEQIKYALLTKEHVLTFGPTGTGKSDLIRTLYGAIEGSEVFSIGLSKFMPEGYLIGMADPTILKNEGWFYHRPEGTILSADFADLDEFFDANSSLQRMLLGILNEREFKRGRQHEEAKLHTALASTNADPNDEVRNDGNLSAVVDRFLFRCKVVYLQSSDQRRRMYAKYLSGATPQTKLTLEDLQCISDIVVDANQITSPVFIELYEEITEAFKAKIKPGTKDNPLVISDRRLAKALQVIEAEALLNGRYEVEPEDIYSARWVFCLGDDTASLEMFNTVAEPLIKKAMADLGLQKDDLELKLLEKLKAEIPNLSAKPSAVELVEIKRSLNGLMFQITQINPQRKSTQDFKHALVKQVGDLSNKVDTLINNGPRI